MVRKGDVVSERELDELVHEVQVGALAIGQIPIAGVVSRKVKDRHEVLGFGHNHLRSGLPGIHGETGALINTGRLGRFGDWEGVTITSSLNPCNFCQRTMCCHLGIRSVRILDNKNLVVEPAGYERAEVVPKRLSHGKTAETFRAWVTDPANGAVWNRDIGIYDVPTAPPFDLARHPARTKVLMELLHHHARLALEAGEAPMAAMVLDAWGEVLSVGQPRVMRDNDPTKTAAMTAWRNAGARDHWKDKTLVLSAGPDHIAYAMMTVFNFGHLAVASPAVFEGTLGELAIPQPPMITVLRSTGSDGMLKKWMKGEDAERVAEYVGSTFGKGGR